MDQMELDQDAGVAAPESMIKHVGRAGKDRGGSQMSM